MGEPRYRQLALGEPAPWFRQRTSHKPLYHFHTIGGRYIVLCFFGSAGDPAARAALEFVQARRALFDDDRMSFFGVSADPEDETLGRVRHSLPGMRYFWDFDGSAGRLYGALPEGPEAGPYRPLWVVLNPGLQVRAVIPFQPDGSDRSMLEALLARLPPVSHYGGVEMHAPIIILPHVLERETCEFLIRQYEAAGGQPSGFMRDIEGRTVQLHDGNHKNRSDYTIEDPRVLRVLQQRVLRTVVPMIQKVHCFAVTRMERYLVGCYDASSGGHFAPHRDNTTLGTAHRRFALSVNLNDGYEGGELCFPEYGPRGYKVPAGSAIVFSGSLLHEVSPVRSGRRYAFLPFLYDDAAAAVRASNNKYLAEDVPGYEAAGLAPLAVDQPRPPGRHPLVDPLHAQDEARGEHEG
jgi:predicted 2-oxoglutarate/Fe(II)-dependent dioxygenase YbiX/peroxiredoxin